MSDLMKVQTRLAMQSRCRSVSQAADRLLRALDHFRNEDDVVNALEDVDTARSDLDEVEKKLMAIAKGKPA